MSNATSPVSILFIFLYLVVVSSTTAYASCPPGKEITQDTNGQCCWPNQVWHPSKKMCFGPPKCPDNMVKTKSNQCVCKQGTKSSIDSAGQCCWPGQIWRKSTQSCFGEPVCPGGMKKVGNVCMSTSNLGKLKENCRWHQRVIRKYESNKCEACEEEKKNIKMWSVRRQCPVGRMNSIQYELCRREVNKNRRAAERRLEKERRKFQEEAPYRKRKAEEYKSWIRKHCHSISY